MRFAWLIVLIFALAVSPALATDSIDLTVLPGAASTEVTLQWTGDQPLFELYRSTNPASVTSPANLCGTGKFICAAETSTLNKLNQTYGEIRQTLVDALADYDANVLPAGRPGFSPVAPLTRCP
jgi:hypothetical protein